MDLQEKYNSLQKILRDLDKVVVAYSGGVDSTFLLKAAVETLGSKKVLACISVGPSLPQSQYTQAIEMAEKIGANVRTVETDELKDSKYLANKADRCFHCKSYLYEELTKVAKKEGYDCVVCGSNLDDEKDYRPGNRAADVFGIRSPLMEAGLGKDDIRQLSRQMNLPTADMPASPCLASRVAYGLDITEQRLGQIEKAEEFLRQLGFTEFRVRHHDTVARIEVHPEDMNKIMDSSLRLKIVEKLKSLGFNFVALDLEGFRSGSLNESLGEKDKEFQADSNS